MPEIFVALHSTLMINFIKTDRDFSQTAERIVPAMTKDSIIIETLLQVRILYYREGEMIFVGILKKVNEDQGFLMFNIENNQVLGINNILVEMMN